MVKKNEKTAKEWLTKIQKCDASLNDVPEELRTAELCLAAVQQNAFALENVPEKLKTAEICLAAVHAVKYSEVALKYVPRKLKTAELCLAAVQQNAFALDCVPKSLRTPELISIVKEMQNKKNADGKKQLVAVQQKELPPKVKTAKKTAPKPAKKTVTRDYDEYNDYRHDYAGGDVFFDGHDKIISLMRKSLKDSPKSLLGQLYDKNYQLFGDTLDDEYVKFDFKQKKIKVNLCNGLEKQPAEMWLENLILKFPAVTFIFEQACENMNFGGAHYFKVFKNAEQVFERWRWYKHGLSRKKIEDGDEAIYKAIDAGWADSVNFNAECRAEYAKGENIIETGAEKGKC